MGKIYKCIGCGARVNGFVQDRDAKMPDLPPCAMCDGTKFVPLLEQLPPEPPINIGEDNQEKGSSK